jgi:hypothetical protein
MALLEAANPKAIAFLPFQYALITTTHSIFKPPILGPRKRSYENNTYQEFVARLVMKILGATNTDPGGAVC